MKEKKNKKGEERNLDGGRSSLRGVPKGKKKKERGLEEVKKKQRRRSSVLGEKNRGGFSVGKEERELPSGSSSEKAKERVPGRRWNIHRGTPLRYEEKPRDRERERENSLPTKGVSLPRNEKK